MHEQYFSVFFGLTFKRHRTTTSSAEILLFVFVERTIPFFFNSLCFVYYLSSGSNFVLFFLSSSEAFGDGNGKK